MKSLSVSLALLAAGAALLASAAVGVGPNQPVKGGTLRLSSSADFTVDPALAYVSREWTLEFATCAKLFNFPDAAGARGTRVIPEVAVGFPIVSPNGRVYTFDLKRTFRFQTGAPVTAASFAAAFNRDANPRMHSPATGYMREIVGVDAVITGKATTISGVRALTPYRLRIRLTKPVGDFAARLTMPFFCPLPLNTPIDPAGVNLPAGSGPYYVAERVLNRQTVFKRNPYYRGERPAHVDRIVYTLGDNADPCLLATEQDRTDYCINPVPDATLRQLAERYGINRPGGQFFVSPTLVTWFFAFNHDRPAFKGPGQTPLAKAINYAIDRPALARAFGYLAGRRTDQMLPPALGTDAGVYPLGGADPATARRWLARAKFKPARLILYASSNPTGVVLANVFAFDLKQIGIDVDVKYFERSVMLQKAGMRGEPFDVVSNAWGVDYPDGASFFVGLLSGTTLRQTDNTNLSYFDDPTTNARIDAANQLVGEARRTAWARLDIELMRNDPPWAPYIHPASRVFVSKSFGCFVYHPVYGVGLAAACKK